MNEFKTNPLRHAVRTVSASIVALALVACGGGKRTAVLVPASELPYLGKTTTAEINAFPVVTTIEGYSHEFKGPVERVEMNMKKRLVPVDVPFTARIDSDQLEVTTDQARTYPMADIANVRVEYNDQELSQRQGKPSRARRNVGLALGLGSIVPLSIGLVVLASDCNRDGAILDVCVLQPVAGGTLLVAGAGLLIAGLVVANTGSSSGGKRTMIRPRLQLSPTGASFSAEF